MPHSTTRVIIHLVFGVKNSENWITPEIQYELHGFMWGMLQNNRCDVIAINGVANHVHLLFVLSRSQSLANIVGRLKKGSTDWLKKQSDEFAHFAWQTGYGAFSVSCSDVGQVEQYIRNQQNHHKTFSFDDEVLPTT
ncbi:MAG: IS200/IS605 family transposase [Desulfomonilaceae bacterium]|jgi:REP element-mobilizing transposase RayT